MADPLRFIMGLRKSILLLLVPLSLLVMQLFVSIFQLEKDRGCSTIPSALPFFMVFISPSLMGIGNIFCTLAQPRHGLRIIWLDPTGKQSLVAGAYLKLKARWLQISGLMTILALVGLWFLLALPLSFRYSDWCMELGISKYTVVVCLMDRLQPENWVK